MADLLIDNQSAPSTPAAGKSVLFIDSTAKVPAFVDDSGRFGLMGGSTFNAATAAQGAGFATDTYVTNSDLLIPSFGLQAKTMFRWVISVSKTAAGAQAPVFTIRTGTNRSTADTSRLAITGSAQSAAADVAVWTLYATQRSVGGSGVLQGTLTLDHNLASTGFSGLVQVTEATSAGFDTSGLGGSYVGLSINGGTSAAWTISQVRAEAMW